MDSNQPVRVRSAESSSRGRGVFGAGDPTRTGMTRLEASHPTDWMTHALKLLCQLFSCQRPEGWHRCLELHQPSRFWRPTCALTHTGKPDRSGVTGGNRTRKQLGHSQPTCHLVNGHTATIKLEPRAGIEPAAQCLQCTAALSARGVEDRARVERATPAIPTRCSAS